MGKTFSGAITQGRLLAAGIRNNTELLASVSLGVNDAQAFEDGAESLRTRDARQEKLKADLKAETAALEKEFKDYAARITDAKKRIKLAVPQERWKEFGIEDKN